MNICRGSDRRSGLAAECAIWLLSVLLCLPAPALAATITINDTVDHRVMGNGDPDDNGNDNPPGFPDFTAPDNNSVIITNRGLVQGDVYGAYNTFSSPGQTEAKYNKVELQDAESIGTTDYRATVTGNAYGAYILNSDGNASASGNELVLNKSARIEGNAYGGYARSEQSAATASDNKVTLGTNDDAADSGGAVYGGYAWGKTSATATDNEVTVRNSRRMHGAVFGGYAQSENNATATGNLLDFYSPSTTGAGILFFEDAYGGYASGGNAQAIDNRVEIHAATSQADIYGGYAQGVGTAEAKNNEVNIAGGEIEGNIYGGYAQAEASATASGNHVLLNTSYVKGAVFGGYAQGETSATATGNTVTVGGASKIGDLYGGFSTVDDDAYTGNTLNKLSSESTIDWVRNVQTVKFSYAGDANIGKLDVSHIGGPNVTLNVGNGDILFKGEIHGSGGLIKDGGDSLTVAGPVSYRGETQVKDGTLMFNSLLGDGKWGYGFQIETGAALAFNQTQNQTLSASIFGNGGRLIKNGPGTLTMAGNTVQPATSVEGGALRLKDSEFLGSVEVSGAVLSGYGRIQGDTSIQSSGDRDSSLVVDGSLAFGNDLALATSTNLVFNQDGQIRVQRDLNDSGANYAANLEALGFYVLAGYDGNATLTSANGWINDAHAVTVALNGVVLDANYNVVLKHYAGQKQIALTALPDGILPKFWRGSGAANWESAGWASDYSPTAANTAWDDSVKSFAVFGAPGAIPATVTLTEDHTVHGLAFVQDGYILDGPGRTLTLTPLLAGNPAAIGVQNQGETATINVALGGSNGLFKTGNGELVLGGPNTYTGMTTVRGGTLSLGGSGRISDSLTLFDNTAFNSGGKAVALARLNVLGQAEYAGTLNTAGGAMNFLLPEDTAAGSTMLRVDGDANIAGSRVDVVLAGGSPTLQPGQFVKLVQTTGSLSGKPANASTGELRQGITRRYTFGLTTTADALNATILGGGAAPEAKALSEGRLAGLSLANRGADLAAGAGMDAALRAAKAGTDLGHGFGAFYAMSGGSLRYNTGSHVDMHSLSLLTGISLGADTPCGRFTAGAFFEYGNGSYDTHNSFAGAASVDGGGDTRYTGGGLLGRMDFHDAGPGRLYIEASGRAGTIHNEWDSSDLRDPASGATADYDTSSFYYGLHLGTGYVWNVAEGTTLDLHTRYFWTRQEGDSVTVADDSVEFKSIDSRRWRAGARLARTLTADSGFSLVPYIGAAYEYEFDGKARATTYGFSIDAPDLKGGTGIGELGFTVKPFADSGLSLALAVQGYAGKREGATGSFQFKWEF